MVDCLAVYDNDMIAVDDPETANTAVNMYETLVSEGHDARLLRFSPSDDGTIPGSHQDPKNTDFWKVGSRFCLPLDGTSNVSHSKRVEFHFW